MFTTDQSRRVSLDFKDSPSLTEQSHVESCDIHNIMRKYERTGVIEHVNEHKGTYGNYVGVPDYNEAQNIIADAKSLFESVPAKIRADMHNDPAEFIEFMQNAENREKIEAYGLDSSHLPPVEPTVPLEPRGPDTPPPATEGAVTSEDA